MIKKYTLNTDGGSRGNPGASAIGVVMKDSEGTVVFADGKYIGTGTNNEAEYCAIIYGLKKATELNIKALDCYLDSELVVKQINGQYTVKEERLQKLHQIVKNLQSSFENITFNHVLRKDNKEADKIVNLTLDKNEKETKFTL